MIVGRWYVPLSAIWHWYLLLSIYITFFLFGIIFIHSFFLILLFSPAIDKLDGMVDDISMS